MLKKISAFIAVLVIAAVACVPAFAAKSPSGNKTFEVTVSSNRSDFDSDFSYVKNGDNYELKAMEDTDRYTFAGWEIEGEYEIISGSLDSPDLVIRPIGDVKIKQVFDDAEEADVDDDAKDDNDNKGETNNSDKSPATGSNAVAGLAVLFAAAGATVVYAAKKAR